MLEAFNIFDAEVSDIDYVLRYHVCLASLRTGWKTSITTSALSRGPCTRRYPVLVLRERQLQVHSVSTSDSGCCSIAGMSVGLARSLRGTKRVRIAEQMSYALKPMHVMAITYAGTHSPRFAKWSRLPAQRPSVQDLAEESLRALVLRVVEERVRAC